MEETLSQPQFGKLNERFSFNWLSRGEDEEEEEEEDGTFQKNKKSHDSGSSCSQVDGGNLHSV